MIYMSWHEDMKLECREEYVVAQAMICRDMKKTWRNSQNGRELYAAAYGALCHALKDVRNLYVGA